MEDLDYFFANEEKPKEILMEGFCPTLNTGYGVLIQFFGDWMGDYYKRHRYSLQDEICKAERLVSLTGGDIEKAVSYLEYTCRNSAEIDEKSWREFISQTAEM